MDTLITENKILGSHCEGIFIVDGGNSWILRNLISHNVQGVVIAGSIPYLFMNKISQNKANGLMLIKQSQPTVIGKIFHIQQTMSSIMMQLDFLSGIRASE